MKFFDDAFWSDVYNTSKDKSAERRIKSTFKRYERHLDKIMPHLTKRHQNFIKKVNLHDGKLDSLELSEGTKLSVLLRIYHPTTPYVYILKYLDIKSFKINYQEEDSEYDISQPFGDWLYNEWTLLPNKLLRHEISFSSDTEILVECKHFSCSREKIIEDKYGRQIGKNKWGIAISQ